MPEIFLPTTNSTPLWDEDQAQEIATLFDERYRNDLDDEYFSLEGCLYNNQIHLRVTLHRQDESKIYPVECLCPTIPPNAQEKDALILRLLDAVDTYWYNYFQNNRDMYLTLDWKHYQNTQDEYYLRGEIRHPKLEAEADAFLKAHGVEL